MDERRNHYRVLHLQPDAPFEVVRANYRAMMMKLGTHPDLGGDTGQAARLNIAYGTLSDADQRAAYDRELLERYDLRILAGTQQAPSAASNEGVAACGNQRNYYRLLEIQPGAPLAVIESSYAVLLRSGGVDRVLLDEARATLCDEERRGRYDEALGRVGHAAALDLLGGPAPPVPGDGNAPTAAAGGRAAYEPLITSYCAFCKTPHACVAGGEPSVHCGECASPLFPPPESLLGLARRAVARLGRDEPLHLFRDWPAPGTAATLVDLSPTGLRCTTDAPLEVGEVLKVEARAFGAVGTVAHHARPEPDSIRSGRDCASMDIGLRFLSVHFAEESGSFVSRRA